MDNILELITRDFSSDERLFHRLADLIKRVPKVVLFVINQEVENYIVWACTKIYTNVYKCIDSNLKLSLT
jgi:hypothetical protein